MSVDIQSFWKLLVDSRLFDSQHIQQLSSSFGQVKGAAQSGNAKTLAEWMISQNYLSRYQATVLLAGRPGPFFYGDYKVYDRVDSGRLNGMFRAVHAGTNHPVLLQFVTGPISQNQQQWSSAAQRLERQTTIVHPQLVRAFEAVDLQTYKFVVLENVYGQSLDEQLAKGSLPASEACRVLRLAAMGLAHLHQQGEVHGDVRPHQIVSEPTGNVRLMRDPLAAPRPHDFTNPDPGGELLCKADYLAPEFAQPGKQPDKLTDIYALGCTFYHLLAGRAPFTGGDAPQKLGRHAAEAIQPLEQFGIPQSVAEMVSYMMAKNASVRYQDVSTIVEQLNAFVDPGQLRFQPPHPPATLSSYEQWLAQKKTQRTGTGAPSVVAATGVKPASPFHVQSGTAAVGAAGVAGLATAAAASGETPKAKDAAEYAALREKAKTKQIATYLGIAAILLIALILLANSLGRSKSPVAQENGNGTGTAASSNATNSTTLPGVNGVPNGAGNSSTNTTTVGTSATGAGVPAARPPREIIVDDPQGTLLWASPTTSDALSFRYVPLGPLLYMVARPAEILASPQGNQVIQALGPEFARQRAAWEGAAGVKFEEVEQLIMTLHDDGGNFPRAAYVVRLQQPKSPANLVAAWGNPALQTTDKGDSFYNGGSGYSFYLPADSGGQLFSMGRMIDVADVASRRGAAPPARSSMEPLRRESDASRHFTVIFDPHDLRSNFFADHRQWYFGNPRLAREPIDWFLQDDVKAGMLSLHFGSDFFAELRMQGNLGLQGHQLAAEVQRRLEQVPQRVEDYLIGITPHEYWKKVAFRFPSMIRFMHQHSRIGADEDQAVINSYLPGPAAANLTFGVAMVLESGTSSRPTTVATTKPGSPQTLQDLLNTTTTMSFDQTALEFTMRDLKADLLDSYPDLPFDLDIKIIGADLEKNGITRNQQVRDFNEQNKSVAQILTALVMKANPITTVASPKELDQKLIWVVGPDPADPAKQIILITTRDAAGAKNYTLPAVFQPN